VAGILERLAGAVNSVFGLAVLLRLLVQARRERQAAAWNGLGGRRSCSHWVPGSS
jgi:hypothetical protein